jgi:hypothetical protein
MAAYGCGFTTNLKIDFFIRSKKLEVGLRLATPRIWGRVGGSTNSTDSSGAT